MKHIYGSPPFEVAIIEIQGVASVRDIHCAILKTIQWVSDVYNLRITFSTRSSSILY
jgi:hypothetical protein